MPNNDQKEHTSSKQTPPKNNELNYRLWPYLLILLLWSFLWFGIPQNNPTIPYSTFKEELKKGNIQQIEAKGEILKQMDSHVGVDT